MYIKQRFKVLWAGIVGAIALLAANPAPRAQSATPDIVDIAVSNPDFSTLVTALQTAGLVDALKAAGPFTVFAPNNAAFAKLPPGTVEALLADPARLSRVLLYHVAEGRRRSTDLTAGKLVTLQGAAATVDLSAGVKIDASTVIAADIEAANGVIHVVDTVLLPPGDIVEIALANPDFSTLVTALQTAGLVDALKAAGPFTVFAPNNAAFAKLPPGTVEALLADPARLSRVLLYHVARGRERSTDLTVGKLVTLQGAAATVDLSAGVKIDASTVIAADIEAANGVIHVVDTVLLPPGDIVEIALANPDFSTLVTALQTAGLVDALKAAGPFTVFAPNNAAFAKLPPGTVEALLADPARLSRVLLYHVARGRERSTDLTVGKLVTLQGAAATVDLSAGVKIDASTVIAADIEAANGVIHVVDTVLLPPGDIVEIALANPDFSTLVTALQTAGLVDALKAAGPFTVFAPNNAAFARLPAGTLDALLQNPGQLREILLYHVVHGPRLRAAQLGNGNVTTMQGSPLRIQVNQAGVLINQASVISADIEAGNGVIHVIDQVVLPADGFQELTLTASVKGSLLTLVWPSAAEEARTLEVAETPSGPWSPVEIAPTSNNGVSKVELEASAPMRFFRVVRSPTGN